MKQCPSLSVFLEKANPDLQTTFVANPKLAYTSNAPTLYTLNNCYGEASASSWLMIQLQNLSEFCGCREKFTVAQIKETANLIVAAYQKTIKVSELMLFFARMKLGMYGKFYGCLDPIVVTSSLREFISDRGKEMYKLEQC